LNTAWGSAGYLPWYDYDDNGYYYYTYPPAYVYGPAAAAVAAVDYDAYGNPIYPPYYPNSYPY